MFELFTIRIKIDSFFIFSILGGDGMAILTPVEERLKSEAEFGLFFAHQKITKTKAEELRKNGFTVIDLHDTRQFPRLHYITWKEAKVDSTDVFSLDEMCNAYTLAQKLWILAMKNQPKNH